MIGPVPTTPGGGSWLVQNNPEQLSEGEGYTATFQVAPGYVLNDISFGGVVTVTAVAQVGNSNQVVVTFNVSQSPGGPTSGEIAAVMTKSSATKQTSILPLALLTLAAGGSITAGYYYGKHKKT